MRAARIALELAAVAFALAVLFVILPALASAPRWP